MADNFNINLDQAAQGAKDVMGLGPAVSQNAAATQNQQQLVQQAIEHTKQAQMQTDLQQKGGLAAEKGLVPKAQVISEINAILATRDDLEDDAKQKIVDDASQTMPEIMNGYDVARFTSALRESKQPNGTWGPAFSGKEVQGGATDVAGNPINPQSHYQQSSEGEYRQAGEQAAELNATGRGGTSGEKGWQALGAAERKYTTSQRGNTLMLTVTRAKQGLALLQRYEVNPTPQILGQISSDIASIMTGGVGTKDTLDLASYRTALSDLDNKLGYYTGSFNMAQKGVEWMEQKLGGGKVPPLKDVIDNLRGTLSDLMATASATIKSELASEEPAFRDIIASDPGRFADMVAGKMDTITSGLQPGAFIPPPQVGAPPAAAPSAAPAQKTQSGISYTVS